MGFVDLTVADSDSDDASVVIVGVVRQKKKRSKYEDSDDDSDDEVVEVISRSVAAFTDHEVAMQLSAKWRKIDSRHKNRVANTSWEEKAMKSSNPGRAVNMVTEIIALVGSFRSQYPQFQDALETIGTDDMVFLAEKLMQTQQTFVAESVPSQADIGYHYTQPTCLNSIRENGLLSKAERDAKSVNVHHNGSSLGDGIYTAQNPFFAFGGHYGDAGLLVVRLMGRTEQYSHASHYQRNVLGGGTTPTVTGNTYTSNPQDPLAFSTVNVLKTSGQCLPMVKFVASKVLAMQPVGSGGGGAHSLGGVPVAPFPAYASLSGALGGYTKDHGGVACLVRLHEGLQKIVDAHLNNGKSTSFTIHDKQGTVLHQYNGKGSKGAARS